MPRQSYRARYREKLWNACCVDSDGRPAPQPDCNICHLPVYPGDSWDESHDGAPKALGGRTVGVAHHQCNIEHGSAVVVPMVAKAKRQHRRHIGVAGPGMGPRPLPGGKRSNLKKTMGGGVIRRPKRFEVHHAAMARRYFAERGI